MARTRAELKAGSRITDYISLGVVGKWIPRERVESVLAQTGRASRRQRDLPGHVVVYYVIALALFMQVSYRHRNTFHETVLAEILQERVAPSRGRSQPRGVKRKMSGYPIRPRDTLSATRSSYAISIAVIK